MECGPDPTIAFAITRQLDFFRGHLGDTERIKSKEKFAVPGAGNVSSEVAGALRRVEIAQYPQLGIVAQLFAQQLLVSAIKIASLFRLRAAGSHLCARRGFGLVESLVRKT